jgi:hypothetical protein
MQKNYAIELFHWAGMNDERIDDLKNLVQQSPELINSINQKGDNALIIAAREDNFKIVQYLVEQTDINIQQSSVDGNAFLVALHKNRKQIARYLLEHGIDYHNQVNGKNAINICAYTGFDSMIETLFDKGVSFNHLDSQGQNIMFDLLRGYPSHQNLLCFEIIQERLHDDILWTPNRSGINVIQYVNHLINTAANLIQKEHYETNLLPLQAMLVQRHDYLMEEDSSNFDISN